ncbi:hypothetical protein CC78DRAFT_573573 [Lojkania enalia]|uniref:Uncharacterized protein n=1 Tax=Lojkania enalia TaxID=147567 RepID=A0A9P4NDN5_9PLEO|nr:hypothetical protein CC78DRAFT_573573 [Didymosphaeria enalia]
MAGWRFLWNTAGQSFAQQACRVDESAACHREQYTPPTGHFVQRPGPTPGRRVAVIETLQMYQPLLPSRFWRHPLHDMQVRGCQNGCRPLQVRGHATERVAAPHARGRTGQNEASNIARCRPSARMYQSPVQARGRGVTGRHPTHATGARRLGASGPGRRRRKRCCEPTVASTYMAAFGVWSLTLARPHSPSLVQGWSPEVVGPLQGSKVAFYGQHDLTRGREHERAERSCAMHQSCQNTQTRASPP